MVTTKNGANPPAVRGKSLLIAFQAYGQIIRQPKALGYILCMGLTFAGMFAFITTSPFIYIEYFGISAQFYAWLFALNIGGIMLMSLLNARLGRRVGTQHMLRYGSALATCSVMLLMTCTAFGLGGLAAVVFCVLLFVSVTGLIAANCLASLMTMFARQAGAAAGLVVSMQFAFGTLGSGLVGALYDGTPWPMAIVMGVAGIGVSLAFWLASR